MGEKDGKKQDSDVVNLGEPMGPVSWAVTLISIMVLEYVILQPRWYEYILYMLVDVAIMSVYVRASNWVFLKTYGEAVQKIFPKVSISNISLLPHEEKKSILRALYAHPMRFARWCYWISFPKIIPGTLLVVFYFSYSHSKLTQFLLYLGICICSFLYFRAIIYLESHRVISKILETLHARPEWHAILALENRAEPFKKQARSELLMIFSPPVLIVTFQSFLIYNHFASSKYLLMLLVSITGVAGFVLFSWILYLWYGLVVGGYQKLHAEVTRGVGSQHLAQIGLADSSHHLLWDSVRAFNMLFKRISRNEREMAALVLTEAEKARFTNLGAFAGALAHDLGSPIHSIYNISQSLVDNSSLRSEPRYYDYLLRNARRCQELVNSMQCSLRRNNVDLDSFSFGEVHDSILSVLKAQYGESRLAAVEFLMDPELRRMQLMLPRPETTQILDNLYRNYLDDMLSGGRVSGRMTLNLVEDGVSRDACEVEIADDGSGLTPERFEQLTAFGYNSVQSLLEPGAEGLGLRLTRRLVELMEGDLRVLPHDGLSSGTVYRLRLKRRMHASTQAVMEMQ